MSRGIIFPPQPIGVATGSTIPTSSATNVSSPTDYDVSRELDNFFMNLFSAFDIFAQTINLVCLTAPLDESDVTFYEISDVLTRRFTNETITTYLSSLKRQYWYKDMKAFRKCTTHRRAIPFYVESGRGFMDLSWMTTIVLPDDPFSNRPTYSLNRKIHTFGVDIFKESLSAIDHMYSIIEARTKVANCIPV